MNLINAAIEAQNLSYLDISGNRVGATGVDEVESLIDTLIDSFDAGLFDRHGTRGETRLVIDMSRHRLSPADANRLGGLGVLIT